MGALVLWVALTAGLPDRGVFPELGAGVALQRPVVAARERIWLRLDPRHRLLTLYQGADPLKAYALAARAPAPTGAASLSARAAVALTLPADRAELERLVPAGATVRLGTPARAEDRDGDGIVDPLDILLGARKLLGLHAAYVDRYVELPYPGGDVPPTEGVCSDTIVRALRNAGIDLQKEVHEDLVRAPAAYPMVERIDASINHRRVRTLLRWFERHFALVPPGAPLRPGDIVFLDTFPAREGPDHVGIVSDRLAPSGRPLVINHWTVGTVDAEMDLLGVVPITHRFRAGPAGASAAAAK